MARKGTPTVQSGLLVLNAEVTVPGAERVIVVGTGTWYAWLEEASAFAFIYHGGTFTARKERFRRGGWYWRAYRRHHGRLVRAYLGKSEQLSLDCLEDAARRLARPQAPIAAGEKPWPETESMQIAGGDAGLDIATRRPIEPTRDTMLHAETRLIATKLIQPALPRDLAPRPRLTEMLKRCTEAPLAIIVSPAGYGKTTLLAEWIATCVPRVAWVSLDRSDIEPPASGCMCWPRSIRRGRASPGIPGLCSRRAARRRWRWRWSHSRMRWWGETTNRFIFCSTTTTRSKTGRYMKTSPRSSSMPQRLCMSSLPVAKSLPRRSPGSWQCQTGHTEGTSATLQRGRVRGVSLRAC